MSEPISTDTATLRKIITECPHACNKEADIAVLKEQIRTVGEDLAEMKGDIKVVKEYITKSNAEKNVIMAVVGLISAAFGGWVSK